MNKFVTSGMYIGLLFPQYLCLETVFPLTSSRRRRASSNWVAVFGLGSGGMEGSATNGWLGAFDQAPVFKGGSALQADNLS
jgi:hypothetical protein